MKTDITPAQCKEVERLKVTIVSIKKAVDKYNYRVSKLQGIGTKPDYIKLV